MRKTINHETLGIINYEESFWTGNKNLSINGEKLRKISKETFVDSNENNYTLKGGFLNGATLHNNEYTIEIFPKTKWYEYFLVILTFVIYIVWNITPNLQLLFPVVGGALGGFLAGLGCVSTLILMKLTEKPIFKILIWLGLTIVTFLVLFLVVLIIAS